MAAARPVTIRDIKPTPPRVKDKTGQKIGKVEILGFSRRVNDTPGGCTFWVAKCECGKVYELSGSNSRIVSMCWECGQKAGGCPPVHGMTGKPIWRWWVYLKKHANGRVCKRWLNFVDFYADVGDVPECKRYLHIPDSGQVNAETCFWSDVQNSAKYIDGEGLPTTLEKLGKELGVSRQRVEQKLAKARSLGVDELEYLYADHTGNRAKVMRERSDETYSEYLVEGITHHVFESADEALTLARRLASFVKSRGGGKINVRVLGNHALFKYEAN